MDSKKLVFVTESLTHGGAERVLSTLVNELKGRGFSIVLILLTTVGFPDFYRIAEGVKVYRLEEMYPALARLRKFYFLGFCLHLLMKTVWLRKLLWAISVGAKQSFLISFMTPPNVISSIATLGSDYRTILCERVYPQYESGLLARIGRFLFYRFADVIAVQTDASRDWFGPKLANRISVIPNALSELPPSEGRPRQKLILGVGRLVKQKRFDLLIKAFAQVSQELPEWNLQIVGEGSEASSLFALARKLKVDSRVEFLSVQKEIWKNYDRCGIFVLSSDYEGFPNVLLEAMSRGTPCISTDCFSGPRDLIVGGHSGILMPVANQAALERALLRLAKDENLRDSLGREALAVKLKHSLDNIIEKWISLFNKL